MDDVLDRPATVAPVITQIAERLGVPAGYHTPYEVDMPKYGLNPRKNAVVAFSELPALARSSAALVEPDLKLGIAAMEIHYKRTTTLVGLAGDHVALLSYSEWQDWQEAMPPRGTFMPAADFLAKWERHDPLRVVRRVVEVALGVETPARQAVG